MTSFSGLIGILLKRTEHAYYCKKHFGNSTNKILLEAVAIRDRKQQIFI